MGGANKLLAEIGGKPLVRIAAEEALKSRARPLVVVTGHQRERVQAALAGSRRCNSCTIPDFADGLSTSLQTGLSALPDDIDGALVLLADMPRVDATLIDKLISALSIPDAGRAGRGADFRRQARQSGSVVAAVSSPT